jgi:hypothetical protein
MYNTRSCLRGSSGAGNSTGVSHGAALGLLDLLWSFFVRFQEVLRQWLQHGNHT